jgi:hypothetical protein
MSSVFVFKSINGFYPNVLNLKTCPLNTRGKINSRLILSHSSSSTARFTITSLGATLWNDLPDDIRSLKCSLYTFKLKLKNYMLQLVTKDQL